MKVFLFLATWSLLTTTALCDSPDHTGAQNNAATGFAVSGVKIGMSLDDIKSLNYSTAPNSANSDTDGEVSAYEVDNVPNIDLMIVRLSAGKVFEVYVFYFPSTIDKIGGWKTLYNKLTDKLGPSEESSDDAIDKSAATWQFFSVNRFFGLDITSSGSARLDICDKEASRSITALKASKAKVGF